MLSRLTHLAKRAALTSNKSTSMKVAKRSLISDLSTNMRITGNDGYEINPDVDPMLLRDLKREMKNNEEKDSSNIKANEEAPEDHWEDYIDPKIKQKQGENKSKVTLDFA